MACKMTIGRSMLVLVCVLLTMIMASEVSADWSACWWDDFDLYDGTYNFSTYYTCAPQNNYWHVTNKDSAFTRRLSGDSSLWYGNEENGTYADDVEECVAVHTIPINVGGNTGDSDRDVIVIFNSWEEIEGVYGSESG